MVTKGGSKMGGRPREDGRRTGRELEYREKRRARPRGAAALLLNEPAAQPATRGAPERASGAAAVHRASPAAEMQRERQRENTKRHRAQGGRCAVRG